MIGMRRREFITLLGGAAAWPLTARAQQSSIPVVGFLYPGVPELSTGIVAAFRKGLGEVGASSSGSSAARRRRLAFFGRCRRGRSRVNSAALAYSWILPN